MEFSSIHTISNCHTDSVNCLAFSPDGRFLASGADDCVIYIYDYKNGRDVAKITASSSVTALLWHPVHDQLLVGFANGDIQSIDPSVLTAYPQLSPIGGVMPMGLHDPIECMALDPSNRHIAVGCGARVIVCRMSKKYVLAEALNICQSASDQEDMLVRSIHFIRGGRFLVITYLEHGIICWNIARNTQAWSIVPRTSRIGQSTISSDEKRLVVSNLLDGFDIYDLQSRKFVRTIGDCLLENVAIPVAFLGKDCDYVLAGSSNGAVKILDVKSGVIARVMAHRNWDIVQAVAYYHAAAEGCHYIASATSEKGQETYITVWRGSIIFAIALKTTSRNHIDL
ncbi:Vegetative incompatibility protein HET-E-1 [Hypsizygus marmoreus]|uniref:Vegetative incompatibility protein HET-E-1 n=1 Tax=Hypsizygus marmoreus TaxID=39966 RepID=A0A369JWG5_HYPMA|nr:Vegetative incompatibility protein HET-E-1 [Hypsizygus marmoreus]